jgi:hypothetical protein
MQVYPCHHDHSPKTVQPGRTPGKDQICRGSIGSYGYTRLLGRQLVRMTQHPANTSQSSAHNKELGILT